MRRVTGILLLLAPLVVGCRSEERGREFAVQDPGAAVGVMRNGSVDRFLPPRAAPALGSSERAPARSESVGTVDWTVWALCSRAPS